MSERPCPASAATSDVVRQTVASATALVLALTSHPEAQRRAHTELDTVVGIDRLPSIDDRAELPYVHAIVKEVGRWFTVVPMGE